MKSLEEMCTLEKQGNLFILTLTGDDEHRLNPSLIDSIRAALKRIKAEATDGSALITTAQGKFFSNGYDLAWATSSLTQQQQHTQCNPTRWSLRKVECTQTTLALSHGVRETVSDQTRLTLMDSKLKSLIFDLFNMPMPTIVAITGHASAAGFILALSHDYVLMRKDRGFLYMSEIDIGLNIPAWFVTLVKNKVKSPAAWREVVMRGTKLTADMAIEQGIVDTSHVGAADTVKAAVKLGEELVARKWDGKVYAHTRRTVFADVLVELTGEIVSKL